jgi:DNA-directed RNA polymerase specialized sigma24 family protein/DNA-binding CsgD family transcriptional regulator
MHSKTELAFERFYPELKSLATTWLDGRADQADDAVQDTFCFALENPSQIPKDDARVKCWLISVLRFRALRVRSSRRGTPHVPPRQWHGGPGTAEHFLVESATATPVCTSDYDFVVNELSLNERELLFGKASDWTGRRRQAEFRESLRSSITPRRFDSDSRVLRFVREHISARSLKDYLSSFRWLERQFGKPLRLSDLTCDLYERYVEPLAGGTRKRIVSVWNTAARLGLAIKLQNRPIEHPANWPQDKVEAFVARAIQLPGNVYRTPIPQSVYWPGIELLAADTRLSYSSLLTLTWAELKANDSICANLSSHTIGFLERLELATADDCFPWLAPRHLFHKYHSRALRQCGVCDCLTPREQDVLHGTAAGHSEAELSSEFGCCIATVRQYRLRIREKLGLKSNTSFRTMVLAARGRGWLSSDTPIDDVDDRIYGGASPSGRSGSQSGSNQNTAHRVRAIMH